MRNALRALAAILALQPVLAVAQSQVPLPFHSVWGRIGAQPGDTGPGQAIPFANLGVLLLGGPQSPNMIYAGPPSGTSANPGFRALVGADLPNPGASSKGGIQSLTCATHQWLNAISIAGVPACAQPNFTDLAGSIAGAQIPTGTVTSAMILDGTIVDADVSASAAIAGTKVNLATTGAPGTVPTLPNDGTKFYNGLGVYSAPPSAGTMILLNTLTASNSATLFDTTSLTNAYSSYEITLLDVIPATTTTTCEIQIHSGGAFKATGYLTSVNESVGGATPGGQTPTTYIPCGLTSLQGAAAPGITGNIRISNPSVASLHSMNGLFAGQSATPASWTMTVSGYWNTSGAIDGFQVLFSAGNITSGVIKIYGIQ